MTDQQAVANASRWATEATEEKLEADGFCQECEQEVPTGASLWLLDGDAVCTACRDKKIT